MSTLVFDIETIGEEYDALDETTQHLMTRWIRKDAKNEDEYQESLTDLKNGLGFSPLTGQIVVIGVLDSEKNKGVIYYQAPGQSNQDFEIDGIMFKQRTECEMIEQFWQGALQYHDFVTFNGRGFDVPFLMIRSAVHRIRPSKNLLSNRYLTLQRNGCRHIDLCDQLSFYGAVWKRCNLHMACRAFGIESPKAGGVTGDDVMGLFKAGKFLDIAKYNVGDLRSTNQLFQVWNQYLNV